ncbi:MAG: hypothetical protein WEG56_12605 [Chloroflexota bacterium]
MPTIRLDDVRLPEFHLPEMSRDDITKAIGDARRDVDLSRFDPRKVELPDIDLSGVDVPKAIAGAAAAAGLVRPRRASRRPLVIGAAVVIGLAGFALLMSTGVRSRLAALAAKARERVAEWRGSMDTFDADDEAVAFDAADTAGVTTSPFADDLAAGTSPFDGPSPLPDGLGSNGTAAEPPFAERDEVASH